jgi:tRNA(Ile2) C34 agmatinyltransferase TiaS
MRRHIPSALRRKIQGTRQAALRLQQQGQHGLLSYKKGELGGSDGAGAIAPLQPIATTAEVVRDRGIEVRGVEWWIAEDFVSLFDNPTYIQSFYAVHRLGAGGPPAAEAPGPAAATT